MADFIERETLKRYCQRIIQDPWNHEAGTSWADAYRQFIDDIDDQEAAEVRPDIPGTWVTETRWGLERLHPYTQYRCSICEMTYISKTRFCPYCGARMRLEAEYGRHIGKN